jgi:hypothetical protein
MGSRPMHEVYFCADGRFSLRARGTLASRLWRSFDPPNSDLPTLPGVVRLSKGKQMKSFFKLALRVSSSVVSNRSRLPKFVNRIIDHVAKNPDGRLGRMVSAALGGTNRAQVPPATLAPDGDVRVYIGPTNYSGQGYLWARALEATDSSTGARNMSVELPGGFAFRADASVPVAVYNRSVDWQNAELSAVGGYTHVLFEAERPLFGSLFCRDVAREELTLAGRGLSTAFLSHGTDLRSPRRHRELNRWSPFLELTEENAQLQRDADTNLRLLKDAGRPVFVSTPDLLIDIPTAHWCPVVVDAALWQTERTVMTSAVPVVAHIPSSGQMKGSDLIEGAMLELQAEGKIVYRRVTGVAAAKMPHLIAQADIVLDQFRLGSYGVAACEAMAAGRVVVGHVLPFVRDHVLTITGHELPIIEGTPDTISQVIVGLTLDASRARAIAQTGPVFVRAVHSGELSARSLRDFWIDA